MEHGAIGGRLRNSIKHVVMQLACGETVCGCEKERVFVLYTVCVWLCCYLLCLCVCDEIHTHCREFSSPEFNNHLVNQVSKRRHRIVYSPLKSSSTLSYWDTRVYTGPFSHSLISLPFVQIQVLGEHLHDPFNDSWLQIEKNWMSINQWNNFFLPNYTHQILSDV